MNIDATINVDAWTMVIGVVIRNNSGEVKLVLSNKIVIHNNGGEIKMALFNEIIGLFFLRNGRG